MLRTTLANPIEHTCRMYLIVSGRLIGVSTIPVAHSFGRRWLQNLASKTTRGCNLGSSSLRTSNRCIFANSSSAEIASRQTPSLGHKRKPEVFIRRRMTVEQLATALQVDTEKVLQCLEQLGKQKSLYTDPGKMITTQLIIDICQRCMGYRYVFENRSEVGVETPKEAKVTSDQGSGDHYQPVSQTPISQSEQVEPHRKVTLYPKITMQQLADELNTGMDRILECVDNLGVPVKVNLKDPGAVLPLRLAIKICKKGMGSPYVIRYNRSSKKNLSEKSTVEQNSSSNAVEQGSGFVVAPKAPTNDLKSDRSNDKPVKESSTTKPQGAKKKVILSAPDMTVQQLAAALQTDTDSVLECLKQLGVMNSSFTDPIAPSLLNFELITKICKKCMGRPYVIGFERNNKKMEHLPASISEKRSNSKASEQHSGVKEMSELKADQQIQFEYQPVTKSKPQLAKTAEKALPKLAPRPPVVTVMGHVDHGKTTLLDHLRSASVVDSEFGGITQHIGAFSVNMKNGKSITFLDTPGHAAFSKMRGRGAKVTDIIVLVVAADDGIMPQTIECIDHAVMNDVPIVVAINKIDKPDSDVKQCIKGLESHGLDLERTGGNVQCIEISALKGTNVDSLQDAIIAQSEMMDLKAELSGLSRSTVLESRTDPHRGKLVTLIVQNGCLKKGAHLIADACVAKVKAIFDSHQKSVQEVGPGVAVEVLGWKDLPGPGTQVLEMLSESELKALLAERKAKAQEEVREKERAEISHRREFERSLYKKALQLKETQVNSRSTHKARWYLPHTRKQIEREIYQPYYQSLVKEETPALSLIIKADVDGSLEAILGCLESYADPQCELEIVNFGVGEVTETDVELARTCKGVVLAFNNKVSPNVDKIATEYDVPIHRHNIIYKLVDDVKELLNGCIPEATGEEILGEAVVQKVFEVTEKVEGKNQKVPIAGSRCVKGTLYRDKLYKLIRNNEIVYRGELFSLKHFKEEVTDVKELMECGIALADHCMELEEGDEILCIQEYTYQPSIEWELPF